MAESKNVRRIQEATRVQLESSLKTKMLGFANETGAEAIGFKKSAGDTVYAPVEHNSASYSDVTVEELAGTGDRNIGVDENGKIIQLDGTGDVPYPYTKVKDPTGFSESGVIVSYNKSTRQVTVSNGSGGEVVELLWNGEVVPSMIDGYTVPLAHSSLDGDYFLFYNGTDYEWSQTPWEFSEAPISYVRYRENSTGDTVALHETHGCNMPYSVHKMGHEQIGTYVSGDGGNFSTWVANSTSAVDRRPTISSITLQDEDIPTTLAELAPNATSFTWLHQTGANDIGVGIFYSGNNDILSESGTTPQFNKLYSGVAGWVLEDMPNNHYQKIFVLSIPVASDTESQKYRYVFVAGQTTNKNEGVIQAISPVDVSWGDLSAVLTEFAIIGEVVIKATGGSWVIREINKLRVSKANVININSIVTSHSSLTDVELAGTGVTQGHINDQAQTIAGDKTFTGTGTFGKTAVSRTGDFASTAQESYDNAYARWMNSGTGQSLCAGAVGSNQYLQNVTSAGSIDELELNPFGGNTQIGGGATMPNTTISDINSTGSKAVITEEYLNRVENMTWTAIPSRSGTCECSIKNGWVSCLGATDSSGVIGTIPVGYRPSASRTFTCPTSGGTSTANITINADGTTSVSGIATEIGSICFPAEQ